MRKDCAESRLTKPLIASNGEHDAKMENTQSAASTSTSSEEQSSVNVIGIKLTPSKNNLDAILQDMLDAEDQPIENDESSNACSDMSSLLPFGNVIPSDCEGSIATGPLDGSRAGSDLSDPELQALRPNEVYIEPAATSTSYGSYFKKRPTCDHSISSNESNSLSSILDSIGWSSSKVHPSRGLKKGNPGILQKYLSGNHDSAHHKGETAHRKKESDKTPNRKALLLFAFLCSIIYLLNEGHRESKEVVSLFPEPEVPYRQEAYDGGFAKYLVAGGVPMREEKPFHANKYADKYYVKEEISLPPSLSYVSNPYNKIRDGDTPLFWIVPKSGSSFVTTVLSTCGNLVLSSDEGVKHNTDLGLEIINNSGRKYVNVETFTPAGLTRATQLDLVASKMADVITTPLFRESLQLFDERHHARAFTLLRHPIDRAVSTFERLERQKPTKNMTLLSYARSRDVENNYLVRYLSGQIEGELDEENLYIAKEMLKRFVIGLAENLEESIGRFNQYFGFTGTGKCRKATIKNRAKKKKVKQGSEAWSLLEWQNKFDLELYKFAEELYRRQGTSLF